MAETKREFEETTGARIIEGYSLTEAMMACCVNPVKGTEQDRIDRHAASGCRREDRRCRARRT
jgi:acyl-CoA synthetase (AMP-forming)/AMP-acid ligase II